MCSTTKKPVLLSVYDSVPTLVQTNNKQTDRLRLTFHLVDSCSKNSFSSKQTVENNLHFVQESFVFLWQALFFKLFLVDHPFRMNKRSHSGFFRREEKETCIDHLACMALGIELRKKTIGNYTFLSPMTTRVCRP